jgi:hypothetical protein
LYLDSEAQLIFDDFHKALLAVRLFFHY